MPNQGHCSTTSTDITGFLLDPGRQDLYSGISILVPAILSGGAYTYPDLTLRAKMVALPPSLVLAIDTFLPATSKTKTMRARYLVLAEIGQHNQRS